MSLEENAKRNASFTAQKATAREAARYKKKLGTWVQVNRYRVPIVYVNKLTIDGCDCVGAYDYANRVIYLDVTKEDVMATFYHELFHAEIIEGGVRQHPRWCSELEEIIVEILSKSIAFIPFR
jgi:hypothetical protein